MNKISFVVALAAIGFSQASWGYRIEIFGKEVKGDDPRPPQIVEDVKKTVGDVARESAKGAGNVVREVSKGAENVLNEAGRVYERNSETVKHIGRISACGATACLSEVHRKNEIDRAKAEHEATLREFSEGEMNALRARSEQELTGLLLSERDRISKHLDLLKSQLEQFKEFQQAQKAINEVVDAILQIREQLASVGEQATKVSTMADPVVARFQGSVAALSPENDGERFARSLEELNASLADLAKSSGRDLSALVDEALNAMDDNVLKALSAYKKRYVAYLATEEAVRVSFVTEAQARLDAVHARLKGRGVPVP